MKKLSDGLDFIIFGLVLLIIGFGIATYDKDKSFHLLCVPIEATAASVDAVELDCKKIK